jgi:hypothetical protein
VRKAGYLEHAYLFCDSGVYKLSKDAFNDEMENPDTMHVVSRGTIPLY